MKNNENKWHTNASDVFSPLYNAVIFIYGNVSLNGNLNDLVSTAGSAALPTGVWRAAFLSFNNIDAAGNPKYAPPRSDTTHPEYQYSLVAGRDIDLSGTPGEGNICPQTCSDAPVNLSGYAGYIYAHEQISMHGNVSVNGIVDSEDAANCSSFVNEPGMTVSGSVQVYYDCIHPPSEGGQGLTLQSWEEVQGNSF